MRNYVCQTCGAFISTDSDHLPTCEQNPIVGELIGVDLADLNATGETFVRFQLLADGTIRWVPIYDTGVTE